MAASKTNYTLANHGDSRERNWGKVVLDAVPNYEVFWVKHVVPLTYRPHRIFLRADIRVELQQLASSSYAVFVHLAAAHAQLKAKSEFDEDDIYVAYSRLYSVREALAKLLAAVRSIMGVDEFGGAKINDIGKRFQLYGASGLEARFEEAFETRAKDYRGSQVHDWGFPVLGGKIPRREFLPLWIEKAKDQGPGKASKASGAKKKTPGLAAQSKGLGTLDAFLRSPDAKERFKKEFISARKQVKEDLAYIEDVVNDVYAMAMKELDTLKKPEKYQAAQEVGKTAAAPTHLPTEISTHQFHGSAVLNPTKWW